MTDAEHPALHATPSLVAPSRRRLLTLLGLGGLAVGVPAMLGLEPVEAKKKKKKKKGKGKGKGNGNKGGGGGGGGGTCNGSIVGAAPASDYDALLGMINELRRQNGNRPALSRDVTLDTAARLHSEDMIRRCFFDHISPDGTDPGDRIAAAGYNADAWAENIYKGSGSLGSAAEAFDGWKNSEGHLANMLNTDVTQIGIGTALDGAGWMNWTNVFGHPG